MDNKLETLADDLFILVNNIPGQVIEGEITAIKVSGKNQYITIKNGDFQISCISWSCIHDAVISNIVELKGEVKVMKKNMSIYFNIKKLSIKGDGNIITEFNKLKNTVSDMLLRKKTAPGFPSKESFEGFCEVVSAKIP